jgi:hypothetical protein
MKLTAIYINCNGKKEMLVKDTFKNKAEFKKVLRENGLRKIEIYNEKDLLIQEGGDFKTARSKKIYDNKMNK